MIARMLCWLIGHDRVLVSLRPVWACRRCRLVWPALCLVLAPLLVGCASVPPPDPLRALGTALSLAAVAITAESRAVDAQVEADYRERISHCPPSNPTNGLPREHCKALAREQTLATYRARITTLKAATELQHKAASATEAADLCRRQAQGCAEVKEREAKALLDDLGSLLGSQQGGPR